MTTTKISEHDIQRQAIHVRNTNFLLSCCMQDMAGNVTFLQYLSSTQRHIL